MDEARPPQAGNIPDYTVSELSGAVRRALESGFGRVRVRGELTEVKRYPSGHIYLSLKDEGGKLSGVIWKSVVPRLALMPENGVEVIATGKLTAYADRSSYQLMIDRLDYAGVGALLARIEALRLKLTAEGLFDAARKRSLPALPGLIGVITSAQGAVLHDIRTTIARRFPRPILLWPVPVQGEGAAEKIAAAITAMGALPESGALRRPDVIIVARGGGSLEDLMAFNDEAVVRAAAACPVPLISAVGHETDTTLMDFAADRRAPTPTAAAELAVPVRTELLANLAQAGARLEAGLRSCLDRRRLALARATLPDLPLLTNLARQRLDDRAARLEAALPGLTGKARARLQLASAHLNGAARPAIARLAAAAGGIFARLSPTPLAARLRHARTQLAAASALLDAVSYERVLDRGYALATNASGQPITRARDLAPGQGFSLRFADGVVAARREAEDQGRLL